MTEKEYINLTNLSKIRTILTLVRDLFPDETVIKKEEIAKIEGALMDWRDSLQKKIKVKN